MTASLIARLSTDYLSMVVAVLCTKPIKTLKMVSTGDRRYKNLYQTRRAFLESTEISPKESIFRTRSVIVFRGSL